MACATSAYCFAKGGLAAPLKPRMSCVTSTWPSQFGPEPMPMIGMRSLFVTSQATAPGTHSITMANAPAFSSATASLTSWRCASGLVAWRRNPPCWCTDCGKSPRWPITGMPAETIRSTVACGRTSAFEFHCRCAARLHETARIPQGLRDSELMAEERQIGHDQGFGRAGTNGAGVANHVAHRDRESGVVTEFDHADRIAHEEHVDAVGGCEQSGHPCIVCGEHHDLFAAGFLRLDIGNADHVACSSPDSSSSFAAAGGKAAMGIVRRPAAT